MAINFPATAGQATDGTFTYTAAGITYSWNGESWTAAGSGASATDLTVFSVASEPTPSGDGSLSYNNNTGEFTYTPPALSDYISKASQSTNVVIGDLSTTGSSLTTGNNNVLLGNNAGSAITTKSENVFIGSNAGELDIGSLNIAIGVQAGDIYWGEYQNIENVYIGRNAGNGIRRGNGHIALGEQALSCNATNIFSFGNIAIGYQAMSTLSGGLDGGSYNTCIGQQAGNRISSGETNVLIGDYAASSITSGSYNVMIGAVAGDDITTGSNNVIINGGDYQNGVTSGFTTSTSNSLWIGHSSYPWIKGTSSGNTRNVEIPGQLTAGGLAYPTSNGTSGQVLTSDGAGNVTWGASSSGLQTRTTAQATASNVVSNGTANISITTPATYALLKIQTSHAAWVTLYTDTTSRTNDASRTEQTDPTPGSGVIAEVITSGDVTQLISPGTIGFNSAGTGTTYAKVVNKSGATASITVTLHYVQLEG
jgi:hypothetical protein